MVFDADAAEAGVEAMPVPELNFSSLVFSMSASRSIIKSPIPMSHSLSSYSKLLVAFVAAGSSSSVFAATVLALDSRCCPDDDDDDDDDDDLSRP